MSLLDPIEEVTNKPASRAEIETICTLYGYHIVKDLSYGVHIRRLRDGWIFWVPLEWSVDDWTTALRKY